MTRDELMAPPAYEPTLPNLFSDSMARYADLPLIVTGARRMTFAQADARSRTIAANLLAQGIGKGTRVGILCPNNPDWIAAFMAVTRIGAMAVLISTLYQRRELGWLLRHADLHGLIMVDGFLSHDYVARLEEIAPSIAGGDGAAPLMLPELPFLRRVWVWGDRRPAWARGAAELEAPPTPRAAALVDAAQANVAPADLAVLMYTSGTTADPKGVFHNHAGVIRSHTVRSSRWGGTATRVLTLGPFCWAAGFLTMLHALHNGSCLVTAATPKIADVTAAAIDGDVNQISAQPALIRQLREALDLAGKPIAPGLAAFLAGPLDEAGRPVPPERQSRGLGMTETVAMHSFEPGSIMPADKPAAFGRGTPDIERRIRDPQTHAWLGVDQDGELCLRGPGLFPGLYKKQRQEVFDADGWYATGDLCRIDADGYLFFHGRGSEMIKTTGANVAPREVELALEAYPDVQEAGVFGLPGEGRDEIVVAVVAPAAEARLDADELRRRLRGDISSFKAPKVIHIVPLERLPRTGSGKLDKRLVKERLMRGEDLMVDA
jgi:acyl-CoA synthetase (AMP-forming)/AMP-acid ligase II